MSLQSMRTRVNRFLTELQHQRQRVKEEKEALAQSKDLLIIYQEAQHIIQDIAKTIQQQAHEQIAGVVSKCLSSVFDEPYEFHILFEKKRKKTEARMVFLRDDVEIDPLTAAGGGVVDVAAFALRVACMVLSRPPLRRTMVLDEPFKHLSAEYTHRVAALMESLSKEMGVRFLTVTHNRALRMGKVVCLDESGKVEKDF